MKKISLTPEDYGNENKKLIINIIKQEGALSRAQIARRTGMSSPAVSTNVAFLIDKGYLIESGIGNNSMGRKSKLLMFNAKKGYVIGLDLGRSRINLMLSDLLGEVFYEIFVDIDIRNSSLNVIDHLHEIIQNSLHINKIDEKEILSIGIGIPGVLDKTTGKIILIPFAKDWAQYNFLEELQKRYSCPIELENSVNLGALGEKANGCGISYKNILYINYSIGIGSALILNNSLFTGTNGVAGEIGYSIPSPSHIRSAFKEEGALEEIISGEALDKRIQLLGIGINSLKELFESNDSQYDSLRESIVNEIKTNFFVILLAITSVINPSVVILSGRIGINVCKLIKDEWEKSLADHLKFPPKIIISESGSLANVFGAVQIALSNIQDNLLSIDKLVH